MKILIIDDNTDNARVLGRLLENEGFSVSCVSDGQEGLNRMLEDRPDLILLDLLMPRVNGWVFLQSRALMADYRDIPVVVLSAWADLPQTLPEGQVAALLKKDRPFREVLAVIRRFIHKE